MSLPRFSVRQPILVNLLTLFLVIAGLVSALRLPREIFPSFPVGRISVVAIYPGVAPEEMENLVALPIEREIKNLDGVDEVTSVSSEGRLVVTVKAEEDLSDFDVSRLALDIQAAIARIPDLPDDMDRPIVKVVKREMPVTWIGIESEYPELQTREMARELKDLLEKVKGVSSVQLFGFRDVEIRVEVDPDKMTARGVRIMDVMNAIKMRHQDIPGGTMKLQQGEYLIRTIGRADSVARIRRVIVRVTPMDTVRVKDVASVFRTLEDPKILSEVNGHTGIFVAVSKKLDADAIRVMKRVRRVIDRWKNSHPEGLDATVIFDSTKYIMRRQTTMYSNGAFGLVLVVFLLLIFLSFRAAVLTAIGIPVAFFGTFVLMRFFGYSMNMLSMFGMIMVLGMIVDDAIVIVENIYRHLMMGKNPKQAAIEGAEEVMWPVVGSVTTTVVAFAALILAPGDMGKILSIMPVVVALALSVSLLEALMVLPSHSAEWLKAKNLRETEHGTTAEAGWFLAFREGFGKVVGAITNHWFLAIVAFVLMLVGSMALARKRMDFVAFPSKTITRARISMNMPAGTSVESTLATIRKFEKLLMQAKSTEIDNYYCLAGTQRNGTTNLEGSHLGYCQISFHNDGETSPRSPERMIEDWRRALNDIPELESFEITKIRHGPGSGYPIQLQVGGPDDRAALEAVLRIKDFLLRQPGVSDAFDDFSAGKQEIHIIVKEERAAMYGLDPTLIGLEIRRSFAGGKAATIQESEDAVDVVVRYPEDRRRSIDEIKSMEFFSPVLKKKVPFAAVATIGEGVGPGRLIRVDGDRAITVYGEIDDEITSSNKVNRALRRYIRSLKNDFPTVTFTFKGEEKTTRDLMSFMIEAFLFSLLGIYIILSTILQSFIQPFIVMMAVPFGAVGVIVGLYAHGMPMSIIGIMGVVGLLGIVVNDSLVMVDFINREVRSGIPLHEAVVNGAKLRLRPIILTTVTTIAGLLPMVFGVFGSEEFLAPMAISIVWGLGFSTLLTLFLVPSVYMMFARAKYWTLRLLGRGEVQA